MAREGTERARRNFLRFLAVSPTVAAFGGLTSFLHEQGFAQEVRGSGFSEIMRDRLAVIEDPKDALTVFDFEETAHGRVPAGHWAYMASGTDDDATQYANRAAYRYVQLRPRRLRDATKVDMRTEFFGERYASPIFMCPTGGERSFHTDGEVAVARAAKARGTMQMLSTSTSIGVETVNEARGQPVWYQLYAPKEWDACEQMLKRVRASGVSVIALTVDNVTGRFEETFLRTRPKDLKQCEACHVGGIENRHRPMYDGIEVGGRRINRNGSLDWAYVDRLRDFWKGKFIIKGIDTHEDAELCLEHGLDGILVSNHGGRSTETGRGTLEALPEVVAAVKGKIPVFIDGGVRRGTDVFKALAMGAKGVGIGRPMLWGLGSFGQAGVDRVLEILQSELKLVMGNCGTHTIADINTAYVTTPIWRR
jgi:isopentenyl diphosphate isomerase/L-lactate dehydrogenase-like FMN-dependent dehydrogenase